MANTILKAEQILSAGLGVLERDVVLPGIIASDASRHFSSRSPKNDTVSSASPVARSRRTSRGATRPRQSRSPT